jgi:hypothetical protein
MTPHAGTPDPARFACTDEARPAFPVYQVFDDPDAVTVAFAARNFEDHEGRERNFDWPAEVCEVCRDRGITMTEPARLARNQQRRTELFPSFAKRVAALIASLEAQDLRPRIQDAWRSPEDQRKAFESGHSKLLFGFHNVTGANGQPEALAVDLLDDDHPLNPGRPYLLKLAAAAERQKLVTGIRWGLPAALRAAIDDAIAAQEWNAPVKIGWDPTHVEPTGLTVTEARAGARP